MKEQSVIQISGGITINVDVSGKKSYVYGKDSVCNPDTSTCENEKNLASIMDDSAIICDEIIYAEETHFNEKNIACKTQNVYILFAFLLIYHYIIDRS